MIETSPASPAATTAAPRSPTCSSPTTPYDIARAKAICSRCVARPACLAGALEREEPWGVWGGEIFVDGVVVAEKRRRGRPPVHPRPAIIVAEVPDVA